MPRDDVPVLDCLQDAVLQLHTLKNRLHAQVLNKAVSAELMKKVGGEEEPAPSTTLVIPLHIVSAPSVDAIRDTACVIPVYTAAGVGLITCILV